MGILYLHMLRKQKILGKKRKGVLDQEPFVRVKETEVVNMENNRVEVRFAPWGTVPFIR